MCFFVLSADVRATPIAPTDSNPFQTNAINNDEETRETVAAFVKEGMDAYGKDQISRAIDHFSRAMLLDPSQETARRYLTQINQQRGLSAQQRAELFLFEDLAAFLDRLQQEKESVSRKCDELLEEAVRAGGDRAWMEAALAPLADKFHFSNVGRDAWDDSRPPLEALNAAFMKMKKDLSAQLLYLQQKYVWLKDRQWDPALAVSAPKVGKDLVSESAHLWDGPGQPEVAVKAVDAKAAGTPRDEIVLLRDELQKLKKELDDLHGYVRAKDAKIAHLSDQVIAFSLKLAEQEMLLNEKVRLTDAVSGQYTDLQSRLELGQKIIEDKNAQIESLQNGLASLQAEAAVHQKELSEMLVLKDGEVTELAGIARIYKDKLVDVHDRLERQQMSIADLKLTVASMRVALFEKETALGKTKQRVNRLEEQLNSAQRESSRHPKKSSSDSEQGNAVEGRIQDLGLELKDIRNFVLRQDSRIGKGQ